ncbi:hypothetical protein SASPL_151105 [Salvia splendens]|uniref:Protein GAMETE EXPRESSED 1 n=1 Tax=Salvia splendens TaxID=180675 RepID=A0A8X8W7E9_SALSN|nr:hypothetical protein SASPL_151105 [Salvia splendens]
MDLRPCCHRLVLLLILMLLSQARVSSSWFFSSNEEDAHSSKKEAVYSNVASEFSLEALHDNKKGIRLIENAKNKMLAPNSCWQTAYQGVFEGCARTLADEELRSRLAWSLSDCFQRHTGRPSFPHCDPKSKMRNCLQSLDRDNHQIYLEYFLETNSICHQLQTQAFKHQTERLVNELKSTAEYAEKVAETSKVLEDHVNSVLRYSEVVYEQSKGIMSSQMELSQGQALMKENLAQGMELLQNSYENLGDEIVKLRNEAAEIEIEIGKVGDAMSSKMVVLQSKADDIGNMAGTSLDKQKELLDGQSIALEGLDCLTKFQSQALEESRLTLQKLAEFGHKQHEELLEKQKQLHKSHDHLVENSKLILSAQETFESKQATMFVALDKLFELHNAMLFGSRVIIAFLVYSFAIFIVYMLTSIKHAYSVRHRLYLGLCATFFIEISIFWTVTKDVERQRWLIHVVRSLFALSASVQYVYAIFTYRDYEVLNHEILMTLMEKVNSMQRSKEMVAWDTDVEREMNWRSWVDTELTEDVQLLEDPDYVLPEEFDESNSSVTTLHTKSYNLHRRS